MDKQRRFNRFKFCTTILMVLWFFNLNLGFCRALNAEGLALLRFRERVFRDPFGALSNWLDNDGEMNPCSWFGIECSEGKVVVLKLQDLCLGGTLAPELGNLAHIKSINLRNNSFSGIIPEEVGELRELELLDLGYNNFSGPLPLNLGNNLSLTILLLDNNLNLGSISPELHELHMFSEVQVDKNQLTTAGIGAYYNQRSSKWNIDEDGDSSRRRLLQAADAPNPPKARGRTQRKQQTSASAPSPYLLASPIPSPALSPGSPPSISVPPLSSPSDSPFLSPSASPPDSPVTDPPSSVPVPNAASPTPVDPYVVSIPSPPPATSSPSPSASPTNFPKAKSHSGYRKALVLTGVIGGSLLLFVFVSSIIFCRSTKVVTVKPWATGLSGQLQKAFVTGVPKLKRSELESACEDFSNIIGSTSDGTMYKGTLSSGVEIAVTSTTVTSSKDWSKNLEEQFRKRIEMLSRINHKNFVNLLGYCEDEEPFTRMMVYEYAPNGTLYEHLHIKEAEHLDWGTRLRIAMGMAYCLEYMHQLTPPVVHKNVRSSAVFLTEDYAAKISYFGLWNEATTSRMESTSMDPLDAPLADLKSNVYSFGVTLFEMITGRLPDAINSGSIKDRASEDLNGELPYIEMVDPTLKSFQEQQLENIFEVVRYCTHPDPNQRPTMRDVSARLKEITEIGPDGATPKLSPLWWAELEILSSEAS